MDPDRAHIEASVNDKRDDSADVAGDLAPGAAEEQSVSKWIDPDFDVDQDTIALCETLEYESSLVGAVLEGKYEVLSRVGAGGMSVVYKGRDLTLQRQVAIKVLHLRKMANFQDLMRFKQEAMAISRLEFPNIVKIHAYEVPKQAPPFMVMDWIEGQSLADLIAKEGPLEQKRCINLLRQACLALQHAHENGVIHRDLKPGNILLTKNKNGEELVKIVDFGIAKLNSDQEETTLNLTRTGDIFGSPLYMSPEQCSGKKLDVRSDIYGLGCVMYEMLAGVPPFEGQTAVQTIQMHLYDNPKSLLARRKDCPKALELDSIVCKALAKDPGKRFQSMTEFERALAELSEKKSGGAFNAGAWFQWLARKRWSGKSKGVPSYVAAAFLAVALVASSVAAFYIYERIQMEQSDKQWPALDYQGQVAFDNGSYAEAENLLTKALNIARTSSAVTRPVRMISSLECLMDLYSVMGRSEQCANLQKELATIPRAKKDEAKLNPRLNDIKEMADRLEKKRHALATSSANEDERQQLRNGYSELDNKLYAFLRSKVDEQKSRLADDAQTRTAISILQSVADVLEKEFPDDTSLKAKVLHHLALAYEYSQSYDLAKKYFDEASKFISEIPVINQIEFFHQEGRLYQRAGDPGRAIPLFLQALDLAGGKDAENKEVFMLCAELSNAYYRCSEVKLSRAYATKAVSMVDILPTELREQIELSVAGLYFHSGNLKRALIAADNAVRKLESQEEKDYQELSAGLAVMADIYASARETLPYAIPRLRRAIAIETRTGTEFSRFQSTVRLAHLYGNIRQYGKQVETFDSLLPIAIKLYPPNSTTMGCFLNDMAFALMNRGDFPRAEKTFKQAISILQKNPNAPRRYLYGCTLSLASLYRRMNKPSEAERLRKSARELVAETRR